MKMKKPSYIILIAVALLFIAVFISIDESEASPAPRRKSSGGRRKSSSGSSGGWGGSNTKTNSNSGYGGNGGYKKKNKMKSNLKKAAVIGATAYGAYQIGKLSGRFGNYGGYGMGGRRYGYNEYNRWREIDGFLCRRNEDCNWVDARLYCQDYELKFTPSALWFGGDAASIVGECACPYGLVWDNYEVQCKTNYFSTQNMLMFILIPILVLSCCCCLGIYVARKMFN